MKKRPSPKNPDSRPPPPRANLRQVLLLLGWHRRSTEDGILKYANEAGWSLDFQFLRTGILPQQGGFDGILCTLGGQRSRSEITEFVKQASVPVVDMNYDEEDNVPAGRVLADNVEIGRLAAEHLYEHGFKNCLFCCQCLANATERDRQHGFITFLAEHGIEANTLEIPLSRQRLSPQKGMAQLMARLADRNNFPLGIFSHNDDLATLILNNCIQANAKVPEQVAVLGCDNDQLIANFAPIRLSSVDNNAGTRAYLAAQMLDHLMDGEPIPKEPTIVPPLGVVTRLSTDIIAVDDPKVATALHFLRVHFADPDLNPDRLAEACGLSTHTLTRHFKREINRTVPEEIRLFRTQRACHLLATTNLTASEIAYQCGFSNLLHLRRTLLRTEKLTPRQWRQAHRGGK